MAAFNLASKMAAKLSFQSFLSLLERPLQSARKICREPKAPFRKAIIYII